MSLKSKIATKLIVNYLTPDWLRRARKRDSNNVLLWTAAGIGAVIVTRAVIKRVREYDLAGKVVLITGGSRGLGLVLAREFLSQGARVAICARDEEDLERAAEDLRRYSPAVFAASCDVSDQQQVETMINRVRQQFGRIDVLVNNAGVISVGPAEEMTIADYEEAMQTNYWAALYTMMAVVPEMRLRGAGRIVNISSIGGKIGVPHLVPYSASKFALVGLSQGLQAELKKDGVVITTVCPGLMRTGSPRNANFKGQHRAEYAWFIVSDSSPLTSISAERAARRIVTACKRGEAELVLSLQAKLATKLNALFPEMTASLLGLANRLLPEPGGIGTAKAKGRESESEVSNSWLTALDDEAARKNNQIH